MNLGGDGMSGGLGGGPRAAPALHVPAMAAALVIAAFLGAAIGSVWQSAGFGEDDSRSAAEDTGAGAGDTSAVRAEASG